MKNTTISVIIRTKNEEKGLGLCLDMINRQNWEKTEVIIVDSGSTDKTLNIAQEYNCKIITIPPNKFSFGLSLNLGIRNAEGRYIVITSAHCLPQNEKWLEFLVNPFLVNSRLAGVYGRQIPFPNAGLFEKRALDLAYPAINNFQVASNNRFSNANSAILKSVWEQFPFDEILSGAEDIKWCAEVRSKGFAVGYEPRAVVYHSHEESMQQAYIRFYREANALKFIKSEFFKKHSFLAYIPRYFRSIILDYLFLFKNPQSLLYFIKWLFLTPFYRMAIYYGQYKGSQKKL